MMWLIFAVLVWVSGWWINVLLARRRPSRWVSLALR